MGNHPVKRADPLTVDIRHIGLGESNIEPFWNLIVGAMTDEAPDITVTFLTLKSSFRIHFMTKTETPSITIDPAHVSITSKYFIWNKKEMDAAHIREQLAIYEDAANLLSVIPVVAINPDRKITMTRLVEYFQISSSVGIRDYLIE